MSVPADQAAGAPPRPVGAISDAWFAAPLCRNCGARCETTHCPRCGQKAARRLRFGDMARDGWERLRLFELRSLRTAGRLLLRPGTVARDYVYGRRTVHMHPLTLLVALVALLVVMLGINRYFEVYDLAGRNAQLDAMSARVVAYANWSFSLGIVAVFLGSWTVFNRRCGYNAVEHAVLAVYCQAAILIVILVNLLPTLIWRDHEFIVWHKAASAYYVPAIKLAIVAAAYRQFFALRGGRELMQLAAACAVFAMLNWVLLRLYATVVLWLVS